MPPATPPPPRVTGLFVLRSLSSVAERAAAGGAAREYERDTRTSEFARLLGPAARTPNAAQLNAAANAVLAQVGVFARGLHADLNTNHESAIMAGIGAAQSMWRRYERTRLQVDDDAVARAVNAQRQEQDWGSRRSLALEWTASARRAVKEAVADARSRGLNAADTRTLFTDTLHAQLPRLERLARTEAAFAFNAAQTHTIVHAAARAPDLRLRWTELVDDVTGAPLDPRVAADSLVLHGQLVRPGALFTMPRDNRISATLWGKQWAFPPNRPNDRAVVLPWRPAWGIRSYVLDARGRRVSR